VARALSPTAPLCHLASGYVYAVSWSHSAASFRVVATSARTGGGGDDPADTERGTGTVNGAVDQPIVAEPTGNDGCPGCGATHRVQRTRGSSPPMQAWSCAACGLHWATTVINPALSLLGLLTIQLSEASMTILARTIVKYSNDADSTV
jgi:ribosomal protein L37AE/L43A